MTAVLVDQYGSPLKTRKLREVEDTRVVRARYDAAQDTNEYKQYWASADTLDSDAANSKHVRSKLVPRSRYEVGNNGYTDGMVQTHVNYMVGTGPQLRMQTNSEGFNAMVEAEWKRWTKAIQFRRKLWCQAHAKLQDGEGFAVLRTNPSIKNRVKLDYVLFETEQCTTPYLANLIVGYIDGIRFDEFGNVLWYDVLPYHPGGQWSFQNHLEPEPIPARFVTHWFSLRRPGQHRAVPEMRSTLNVGAGSRRWREATIASAETAADISVLLHTNLVPNEEADPVSPLSTVEFQKRMMVAAPMGWDATQMRAEHPNAMYKDFHRAQINEQGRPKSMPVNISMADSSNHNFASGKLDHQPWFQGITVEREDGNDLVLDPVFDVWFQEASLEFGWVQGDGPPPHTWDWPALPVADEKARAIANNTNLSNGTTCPADITSQEGGDPEEADRRCAQSHGFSSVQEFRVFRRNAIFKTSGGGDSGEQVNPDAMEVTDE